MTRRTTVKLCMALFILAVTLGIVGISPNSQNAYALPCCIPCHEGYAECRNGELFPECGGDTACCKSHFQACLSNCNPHC